MDNTKQPSHENQYIVRRVSLTDTFKNIPEGVSATFFCRETGPMSSAASCASRLNKAVGWEKYKVTTADNGITYTVTHNKQ